MSRLFLTTPDTKKVIFAYQQAFAITIHQLGHQKLWEKAGPHYEPKNLTEVGQTKQHKAGWFKPEPKEKKSEAKMRKDISGIIYSIV